jgi:hypothetical protein
MFSTLVTKQQLKWLQILQNLWPVLTAWVCGKSVAA